MRPVRSWRVFAAAVLLAALGACTERNDWDTAQAADTHEAYAAFAAKHPGGPYSAEAQRRAAERREQRDWRLASTTDTPMAYRAFLGAHPDGRWSNEARLRLETFEQGANVAAPPPVAEAATVEPQADLPPAESASAAPPPELPAAPVVKDEFAGKTVMHRIQLGAFSSREKALAGWQEARTQHVELQGLVPQVLEVKVGANLMYRLQASVLSEQRAREACKVLTSAGQPCLYVLPGQ
ncbi:MAG: SPOR domain-containing protein [Steroidobacteraceae bacterium]|jgi:cell division septation protein DedD